MTQPARGKAKMAKPGLQLHSPHLQPDTILPLTGKIETRETRDLLEAMLSWDPPGSA